MVRGAKETSCKGESSKSRRPEFDLSHIPHPHTHSHTHTHTYSNPRPPSVLTSFPFSLPRLPTLALRSDGTPRPSPLPSVYDLNLRKPTDLTSPFSGRPPPPGPMKSPDKQTKPRWRVHSHLSPNGETQAPVQSREGRPGP